MDFKVLILGSGAATPTFARHCSGQVVTIGGRRILLDCGESTQNQLRQFHQKLQSIDLVFVSHLHGDHFFGLPGLLSTMHLCGRTAPMTVYAPKGIRPAMELLFDVSGTHIDYPLEIIELDNDAPVEICRERDFKVTAFPLRHSVPTYGYLFEECNVLLNLRKNVRNDYNLTNDECIRIKQGEDYVDPDGNVVPNSMLTMPRRKPRKYAYCCDTGYDESLIPIVADADLLCMDSTFDNSFVAMAEQRLHSTAAQAATIASRAGVKQLLLTHFSARYKDLTTLLDEARQVFPNTVCAVDGALYGIPYTTV